MKTFGSTDTAKVCKSNGWKVGTCLVGDDSIGPKWIVITAIGKHVLLATSASQNPDGTWAKFREDHWTLSCREWSETDTPEVLR